MYNDLFSIGGLTVHGYGLCIGIGIAAALLLIWRRAEERKFDVQSVNTLILLILAAGFAGAKLFFVFAHWSEFRADPLGALGSEGFVVYGGIVCGLGAAYLYCRKGSLPFLRWVDCFIPCVALAQGFGRIGCFLAGCCFGKPTESFLGVTFPAGSMAPAGIPLWPVQLFSAAGDFLLAGALLLLEKHVFLTLGLERLELEVRMDNAAARRCYERAGFRLEGVKRHAFFANGAFCDVGIMSILREEYGR